MSNAQLPTCALAGWAAKHRPKTAIKEIARTIMAQRNAEVLKTIWLKTICTILSSYRVSRISSAWQIQPDKFYLTDASRRKSSCFGKVCQLTLTFKVTAVLKELFAVFL